MYLWGAEVYRDIRSVDTIHCIISPVLVPEVVLASLGYHLHNQRGHGNAKDSSADIQGELVR